MNIDSDTNSKANKNFILKPEDKLDAAMLENIRKEITDFSEEPSAIINLSQAKDISSELSFSSSEIFDEYERLRDIEIRATILTAHLSAHLLAANGYVCFSSNVESM